MDGPFSLSTIEWILAKTMKDRKCIEPKYQGIFKKFTPTQLDEAWRLLRDSFDSIFYFYERLSYLQKNKRITKEEMRYFKYFMMESTNNEIIKDFLNKWDYKWHNEIKFN